MKIEQLLTEHKKGVKAVKYAKKPVPVVGPEALKKKAKAKAAPPKTELEKHSKLATKLETVKEGYPKQQISRYNPDGDTYKQKPMPTLDKDPVDDAEPLDVLKNEPYEVDFDKANLKKDIAKHLDSLNKKSQFVLKAKFWHNMTNDEIADRMNISQERVRQIEAKALRQLRRGSHNEPLSTYLYSMAEGSAQEKLHKRHQELRKKSNLPDPDYYKELKSTYDLPDEERHKKAAELKKKYKVNDMKEAKESEATKPRNFVAKNAKTAGAGKHKDEKKASKEIRGQKHKNKEMAETYDQARSMRIRYYLMLKEGDWDIQSDEMIPPEYDMDPAELKAIRNAEFTEQDKIQAMIKLAAGGTSDEDIAKIYDMDKETVASILDDYVEEIEAETDQDADVKEAEMGKIVDYKPGVSATIDTGPGMTTMLDLKKNPTSLTKDPSTGKLKLMPGTAATAQPSATTQSTVKPGDQVEIPKTTTPTEDLKRLAGLK